MPRHDIPIAPDDADSPPPPDYGAAGEDKNDRKPPGGYLGQKKHGKGGGGHGGGGGHSGGGIPGGGGPGPVIAPQVDPDPDEPDYSNDVWDYIHYAASRANNNPSEMASRISGGNVNARASLTKYTPLHVAVKFDQPEAVRQLIRAGAQIDIPDILEQTPLSLACCYEVSIDIYKQLLDAGANPNYQDLYSWRPLFWAARKGYYNVVKLLLSHNARPNMQDKRWKKPSDVTSSPQIKALLP